MPVPAITLLTDFGDADGYAGILHGVLLSTCPEARVITITNALPRFDLFAAAFTLLRSYPYYPAGTIHLVGVDSGQGEGSALLAEAGGHIFLAGDNGVLGLVLEWAGNRATVRRVAPQPQQVPSGSRAATTFLARDVLAPIAGRLVKGQGVSEFGTPATSWTALHLPQPSRAGDGVRGEVLHVDRFGNLLTNLTPDWAPALADAAAVGHWSLQVAETRVRRVRRSYHGAGAGEVFAIWGAEGWLEISAWQASAAELTGAGRGAAVEYRP